MTSTLSSSVRIPKMTSRDDVLGKVNQNLFPKTFQTPAWGVGLSGTNNATLGLPCVGTTDQAGIYRERVQLASNTEYGGVNPIASHIGQSTMTYNPDIQDGNKVLRQPSNFNAMLPSMLGDSVSNFQYR